MKGMKNYDTAAMGVAVGKAVLMLIDSQAEAVEAFKGYQDKQLEDGLARSTNPAPRSVQRALLTPRVNHRARYRRGEQPVVSNGRRRGA